jgi:hypothetical protein
LAHAFATVPGLPFRFALEIQKAGFFCKIAQLIHQLALGLSRPDKKIFTCVAISNSGLLIETVQFQEVLIGRRGLKDFNILCGFFEFLHVKMRHLIFNCDANGVQHTRKMVITSCRDILMRAKASNVKVLLWV